MELQLVLERLEFTAQRLDPSGRFVYSVNELGDDVSAYSVDQTTGDLTLIGQIPAGIKPRAIGFVSRID